MGMPPEMRAAQRQWPFDLSDVEKARRKRAAADQILEIMPAFAVTLNFDERTLPELYGIRDNMRRRRGIPIQGSAVR